MAVGGLLTVAESVFNLGRILLPDPILEIKVQVRLVAAIAHFACFAAGLALMFSLACWLQG